MNRTIIPFPDRRRDGDARRPRLSAGRPSFDREHCDGCLTLVSRGSLVNRLVDPSAPGMDGWKAICRRCVRLLGEGRSFVSLRDESEGGQS